MPRLTCFTFVLITCVGTTVRADDPPKPLTVERIFTSGEFSPQSAPAYRFRERGGMLSLKVASGRSGRDLVLTDIASGSDQILIAAHRFTPRGAEQPLNIEDYWLSKDESKVLIFTNSQRVWRQRSRGDFWVLDVTAGDVKKLGGHAPAGILQFAKFSPDGTRVAYVREGNLSVQDLGTDKITAITTDGSRMRINGTFDWVYEEELALRDGFRWSPDGRQIAYWQIDGTGVREVPLVNNLGGLYPEVQWIPYPKVGEQNPSARIGVVSAAGGETKWLDVPGDPREHYIAQMDWAGNSDEIVLQQFNRLQNTNKVFLANATSGQSVNILTETDAAWVENNNAHLEWIGDGSRFLWLSERNGWQHSYAVTRKGDVMPITQGDFDVISTVGLDPAGEGLYYMASPENATQSYLYHVKTDGTANDRLTPADQPGTHSYRLSPDAKFAVHTWSRLGEPPVTELVALPNHESVRVLTKNEPLKETLSKLPRGKSEFFRVDIGEGVQLDGWCLLPPEFDLNKKYPVLVYVYGEPAGQTVLDRWGGNSYLWHRMLSQQGYVVLSVDNRGTPAPRGREWRKCVYRQVGVLSSADQAAALRQLLKERPYLDPERVAVWGWSGGGSMTLNLLFRSSDLYRAGMSVAPVPNQRYYDTIYQERYMGLPGDNAEGYRNGSPITFAHQLKGKLLLVHGTGDDNCHFQGTEALVDELVAHNKPFAMFAYPSRSHSISERTNTTRHLYEMLTRFLNEAVPAK